MMTKLTRMATLAAFASMLSFGAAVAQPVLSPQGGAGNFEMDHSRMGGGQAARPGERSTTAPALNPQGGGGNSEMDHSRMGGPDVGSQQGGRITGNAGSGGGPEVDHAPGTGPTTFAPRRTS